MSRMVNRCSRSAKDEWLTCTERRRREARPGTGASCETAFLMSSHRVEAADLRDWPKHRSSCSMAKEDRAAATAMDGSALPATDALPNRNAISKAPRAAGYRGSDFALWHEIPVLASTRHVRERS